MSGHDFECKKVQFVCLRCIIRVVSCNDAACIHVEPLDPPTNFRVVGEPYNSTFAEFAWDPVDPSPERVQGFFRGYRVSAYVL